MSIVAYASANVDPQGTPDEDFIIDLETDPLGTIPNVPLYGAAVDTGDPGAVWAWSWAIIAAPDGSAVSIVDPTLQNIEVQDIDTWANLRLMLVATNTNTGLSSETDPLKAPTSCFVQIRLKSTVKKLQKMARGERNWWEAAWDWVQAMEDAAGMANHAIQDHTDIVDATGGDIEALSNGGYAVDPETLNPLNEQGISVLHLHYGGDVNAATHLYRGTVQLEEEWIVPGINPLVLTRDKVVYTGQSDWSHSDLVPAHQALVTPIGAGFVAGSNELPCHILWRIDELLYLTSFAVQIRSVPTNVGGGEYVFKLVYFADIAAVMTNTFTEILWSETTLPAPLADGAPVAAENLLDGGGITSVEAGYVGVQCTERPTFDAELGYGLHATLTARRIADVPT